MAQSARGSAEITDDAARGSRERGRRNGHETYRAVQEIEPFGKSPPTAGEEEEKSNKHEYECRRRGGEEERERKRGRGEEVKAGTSVI